MPSDDAPEKVNPYLARQARHSIGKAGRKAEKKTAKRLGGRLMAASGALEAQKSDFQVANFRCENKTTTNASIGLKLEWLEKITKEALPNGQTPALALQFVTPEGDPVRYGSWVCIPEHLFKEWLEHVHGAG